MKVLFLDVDGVLNCNTTKERINGFLGLDSEHLYRFLQWKNKHPEVSIVLSSTWRTDSVFTNALREALAAQGVNWIDVTPQMPSGPRYEEINWWLGSNTDKWSDFAILDDITDMGHLQPRLVCTDERHGLQDEHLIKLNKILNLTSSTEE